MVCWRLGWSKLLNCDGIPHHGAVACVLSPLDGGGVQVDVSHVVDLLHKVVRAGQGWWWWWWLLLLWLIFALRSEGDQRGLSYWTRSQGTGKQAR